MAQLAVPDSASDGLGCASTDSAFYVSKLDLSNYYHSLLLPSWLSVFLCLPAIDPSLFQLESTIGPWYPMCLTLPMGFSHAVYLAQCVHEYVLYSSGALSPSDNILTLTTPFITRTLHLIYIDDLGLMGTKKTLVIECTERVKQAYAAVGLIVNANKCIPATDEPVEIIGVEACGRLGVLRINRHRQHAMLLSTCAILQLGEVSGLSLATVIGHWTWALLLRRPALSVLRHVYRFIMVAEKRVFTLWPSVIRELLLPLFSYADSRGGS